MAKKQIRVGKSPSRDFCKNPAEPLVSIVIASYNHGNYLPETIASILSQTYKKTEVVVVDDGSTDDTRQIVSKYPVTYHYQKNKGSSNAFNVGIRMSKGEFYVTPGADDLLLPDFIKKCLGEIVKDNRIGFVWTGAHEFGESHEVRTPTPLLNRLSIYRGTGGQLGAALFRRSAFDDVGGYDEALPAYEDWDLAIRMVKCGWKGVPVMEPIYLWRRHKISRNTRYDPATLRRILEKKYPLMKLYARIAREADRLNLLATHPGIFLKRALKRHPISA
jgi:glycosyltransferase involved in cell wall biosynthesis